MSRKGAPRRSGRGIVEVVAVVGIVGFFFVWALVALPRGRESSRIAGCQKNLMQIGVGLQLYHQVNRQYPTVAPLGPTPGDSPIKAMLDGLGLPDLVDLRDPARLPKATSAPPRGVTVPGLACPSDPNAMDRRFAAAISYRANAGDTAAGQGGSFEPGRITTIGAVEAGDGVSFTAAFAERLVGGGIDRRPGLGNYATTAGPIGETGCTDLALDRWRGDAGSDWSQAGWRSTLYGHLLAPNRSPSCIADDGKTAAIGASSAHPNRVNVLLLDGSVRGVTPSVAPAVWRGLGTIGPANP